MESSFAMTVTKRLCGCPMRFHLASLARANVFVFAMFLAAATVAAASNASDRGQEKPGIALVKPQSWSQDDQATALEFLGYVDRSVKTHPGAGYFEFHTARSSHYQVPASRVVKLVIFPEEPGEVITTEQREALRRSIEELELLSKKFPTAVRSLKTPLEHLRIDAEKYDSGYIKTDGQWIARTVYFKQKANALVEILTTELTSKKNLGKTHLESNQYFRGLLELANGEPSVQPLVESVRALYEQLVRKQRRADILGKLNAPNLTFSEAEILVKQLKSLRPAEDPESSKLVQNWDAAVARAEQLSKQVTELRASLEAEMATASGKPPMISPELSGRVQQVAEAVKQFCASSPSPVIRVPDALARAMNAYVQGLPLVVKQMEKRQYIEAKALLDPIIPQASLIGPDCASTMGGLQRKVTGEVEKFQSLRNEAKMLAEGDKLEEALKKYEEAFAVIPDKNIAAQIEALKKQL